MTQGFSSALVRAHETPARITYTDAQVAERTGINIASLAANHSDAAEVDFAAEYMRESVSAVLDFEYEFCAGERLVDFEPRCEDAKFKFAFLTTIGNVKKNRAIAACYPEKIFPALASGRTRNPSTVYTPPAHKEVETLYAEQKKLVRAATPKLQRAIVAAAGIAEETTSEGWRLANEGKLTPRDKAAIDMSRFLIEKLFISGLTNEKTFAGKEADSDPLSESAERLGMNMSEKDGDLPPC